MKKYRGIDQVSRGCYDLPHGWVQYFLPGQSQASPTALPTPRCFLYLSTQLTVSYRRFSKRLPSTQLVQRVRVLRIRGNFIRSRRHPKRSSSIFFPRSFFLLRWLVLNPNAVHILRISQSSPLIFHYYSSRFRVFNTNLTYCSFPHQVFFLDFTFSPFFFFKINPFLVFIIRLKGNREYLIDFKYEWSKLLFEIRSDI